MAKTRMIEIAVQNRPGTVAAVTAALAQAGVNILSIFGWSPQGILQLIVDDPTKAAAALTAGKIGYTFADAEMVEMSDQPGSLHTYLAELAEKGVNLQSISGSSGNAAGKSVLVWTAGT